jgi:hypothetical protein
MLQFESVPIPYLEDRPHTLEEFLASIFLEEGLVDHRPSQVVNHQDDHRLNLFLRVPGIVLKGLILLGTHVLA